MDFSALAGYAPLCTLNLIKIKIEAPKACTHNAVSFKITIRGINAITILYLFYYIVLLIFKLL
jgi:hypothetical protein